MKAGISIKVRWVKKSVAIMLALVLVITSIPVSVAQISAQETAADAENIAEKENSAVIPKDADIPSDATYWCGHYYKLYSTEMTVAQADAWCQSRGGYLTTITSKGERTLVGGLIDNLSNPAKDYTIGGRTGNFDAQVGFSNTGARWDTGEEDTINYWKGNYYADYCEMKDSAYRILGYYNEYYNAPLYRSKGYWWNVVDRNYTDKQYGFICEWGNRIDIADADCVLTDTYMIYDGTTKTPNLTVKYNGVTLENQYDYTYTYSDNLNIGTATVMITGKGRFKGVTTLTFSIEPSISLMTERDEEITTISCYTSELPIPDEEYLKKFMSELSLEISEEDRKKIKVTSTGFAVAEDGKSAVWQMSVIGEVDDKISVKLSSAAGQTLQKKNIEVKPMFEVNTYRTDYILNHANYLEAVEYYVTMDSPSSIIVKSGKENNLNDSVACWNLLTTIGDGAGDASKVLDIPFKEKEMYQAILIDIFEQSMENAMLTGANSFASAAKTALKTVTSTSGAIDTLGEYAFFIRNGETSDADYAVESTVYVINKALEILNKQGYTHKHEINEAKIKNVLSGVSTAKEIVEFAQEYLEYIITCEQIYAMSEDMQTVLNEMYTASKSNQQMRLALKEISAMTEDVVNTCASRASYMMGKKVSETLISTFWKEMKNAAGPIVNGYLATYKAGKLVANKLGGAEKTAESYVKMEAVLEIEQLARTIYNTKKVKYQKSGNADDAGVYLAALDIVFRCLGVDCEYAKNFCDAADSAWLSCLKKLSGEDDANVLKKSITSIKNSVEAKEEQIATDWIYQLKNDYPKQYENYKSVIEKENPTAVYTVKCPVNVEVYNVEGKKVASVVDHEASWDKESNLVIAAIDDGAVIWFYGNEDYYDIRYSGTDKGSMDITILKYDEDGNIAQKVQYNDVHLTVNTVYSSEENLSDTTGNYSLLNENDKWNPIDPDVDTISPVKAKRNVRVTNGYLVYDEKEGPAKSAECYPGETIYIFTSTTSDKIFSGWKNVSGNVYFLDEKAYMTSFVMPDENVEIQAVYKEKNEDAPLEPPTDNPETKEPDYPDVNPPIREVPKAGSKLKDTEGCDYTVTKAGLTVSYVGGDNKNVTVVTVPSKVKINGVNYKVTSIAANAFKNYKKLKKVTISDGIVSIGKGAFRNCKALTAVKLGSGLVTIDSSVFQNCTALKKIMLPASVKKIGSKAFYNCKKLMSVTIKTTKLSAKNVGSKAFTKAGSKNYKKMKVKIPVKKYKTYKKLLKKKGLSSKAKITK